MDKFILLLEEFIMKAIVMTEDLLEREVEEEKLEYFTANRDRLFEVIESISTKVNWLEVEITKREDISRRIDYIKKLDEKVLVKLQEHQIELRKEIEKTARSKENIKGYNLTDVK